MIDHLEENLCHELPVNVLAQAVGVSSSRLAHLFKTETGTTLVKYRNRLRLEAARQLLESSSMSVKEIAAKAGAANESHFFHDFHRTYDCIPLGYRERHLIAKRHRPTEEFQVAGSDGK